MGSSSNHKKEPIKTSYWEINEIEFTCPSCDFSNTVSANTMDGEETECEDCMQKVVLTND